MRPISSRRRTRVLALATCSSLTFLAACDDSDGPESVARVRFLHAAAGKAAVDFRADGTTRGAALAFGAAWSTNSVLSAGDRTFTARLTGNTADLASTLKALASNASYSVVLARLPARDSLVVYADTSATPADTKAWVRVFNVSPAAGRVDVYITAADANLADATPQVVDVDFLEPSAYVEVSSGAQRVRLTTTGTKTVVLDLNPLTLPARGVRSIAVLDAAAGGAPLQSVTASERN